MRVGVLGGGQLGRMLAQAGSPLGMKFSFLCPEKDACALSLGKHYCADYDDMAALEQFASSNDVITYEFENVPARAVEWLAKRITTHPCPGALRVAQDRLKEKQTFTLLKIPTPRFENIDSFDSLQKAVEEIGLPAILKTRSQGYDGKGQAVLRKAADLAAAWRTIGGVPAILEAFVSYERELSVIAVRDTGDHIVYYPVSENMHREGMLRLSLSRVGDPIQEQAQQLIYKLLEQLDYVGALALELFQVDGQLLANEIAPRVHNSGHWSIEGAATSQFENHLRAISGMPLGATDVSKPVAMVNLIGTLPNINELRAVRGAVPHYYGKSEMPGRKLGHVTLINDGLRPAEFDQAVARLLRLAGECGLAARMYPGQDSMAVA